MTVKQEAEQLVNMFVDQPINFPYIDTEDGQCIGSGYMTRNSAKQCALIAVNEIIQAIRYTEAKKDYGYVGYWNEVKQEIEKL
jgi:hypothetical protein